MSQLIPFQFESHQVRTLTHDDGSIWWVLADVCAVLGLSNPREVASRLDTDGVRKTDAIDSLGRTQSLHIVNEPGLYEVIFRSNKEEAKRFRKWVFEEVLPAIRKTGSYNAPQQRPLIVDQIAVLKLEVKLSASTLLGVPLHHAQQEAVKTVLAETGVDFRPLLKLAPAQHNLHETDRMLEPTELAKELGVKSSIEMNRLLASLKLQERNGAGQWVPVGRGVGISALHAWTSNHGTKTGTNLKWNVASVRQIIGS